MEKRSTKDKQLSKREGKTCITFYLDDAIYKKLSKDADDGYRTLASQVRMIILKYYGEKSE